MSKVFIGVGHGGKDSGACANGLREKDLTLIIATYAAAELRRHGVDVLMSRTNDEDDPLAEEIRECNAYKPDLAVDVHINAAGGDGFEVYHYHNTSGKSYELAKNIEAEVTTIGQNSRGCKTRLNSTGSDYYGFIRQTSAPSVIVECAFIDNPKDIAIIADAAGQQAMGVAIAKGILKTLNVPYIAPEPVEPWYSDDMRWVKDNGISDGTRANDNVTRAEVWSMLRRFAAALK